jgi:DNA-binding response OmpR family regulator
LGEKISYLNYPFLPTLCRKALIIDDESDVCFLLTKILKQKNIQTVTACSLAEADEILKSQSNFSVVFLDNHLPDGLGISYINQLRQNSPESNIIMITAQDSSRDRLYAHANGANFFLRKPFSKESILKTVENIPE